MPFDRELSIEEINHINRQLSAGTHIAILLVDDSEYGYFEFGGAFDQLQTLLSAYIGDSEKDHTLGRGTFGNHKREGIFVYKKLYYRHRDGTDYNIPVWEPEAEVKIVPMSTVLSRGVGGGGR